MTREQAIESANQAIIADMKRGANGSDKLPMEAELAEMAKAIPHRDAPATAPSPAEQHPTMEIFEVLAANLEAEAGDVMQRVQAQMADMIAKTTEAARLIRATGKNCTAMLLGVEDHLAKVQASVGAINDLKVHADQ
jgi:hypothetical protein